VNCGVYLAEIGEHGLDVALASLSSSAIAASMRPTR
jgi:hypothetical protein